MSEHAKKLISLVHKGKKISNKHKKILSKKNSGKNNGMYGKSVYDVWFKKYGKKEADKRYKQWRRPCPQLQGNKNPAKRQEVRDKISQKNSGKKHSEETKRKISLAKKGTKHSVETKRKMSLSRKGENNPASKLTKQQKEQLYKYLKKGKKVSLLSTTFNISRTLIYNYKRKWKNDFS